MCCTKSILHGARVALSWLLLPLTAWYGVGAWVRGVLYDAGVLRSYHSAIPTICVGNLACGGTGKTPHVEYLVRLLADRYSVAVLSRGYRRKSQGYYADDGSHSADLLGDEPAMVARKFPSVKVVVCERRTVALRRMEQWQQPPQVVLLDDAFQHRQVSPSLNILLTDYARPFARDFVLPMGYMREFRHAARRADIVVVTKCPSALSDSQRRALAHDVAKYTSVPICFSTLAHAPLEAVDGGGCAQPDAFDSLLMATGIANPLPMQQYLQRFAKVQRVDFADHHDFTPRDLLLVRDRFVAMPEANKAVVITEKDASRLSAEMRGEYLGGVPLYVLPVRACFMQGDDAVFDSAVHDAVAQGR